jgi:hypothetical protein
MEQEHNDVFSDEAIAEQERGVEVTDDFRAKVAEGLGLTDDEDYKEIIDRAVEREKELRSGYGKLLGKYKVLKTAVKPVTEKPNAKTEDTSKHLEESIAQRFDEEYLEDTDFTDDLKREIRKIAKLNQTSARAATKDPYIAHLIEQANAEKRALEAANNGTDQGRGGKPNKEGEVPAKFLDAKQMIKPAVQKEYAEWLENKQ